MVVQVPPGPGELEEVPSHPMPGPGPHTSTCIFLGRARPAYYEAWDVGRGNEEWTYLGHLPSVCLQKAAGIAVSCQSSW